MKLWVSIGLSCLCSLAGGILSHGAVRQLTGQYAPASTPALPPPEAQKKFSLPQGFEIRIFASEPDLINPVAMTWDERGRLWVVELFEYPKGAAPGTKPRDRIKILEDADGDGRADRVKIFADGLDLATGILLGNGGAYVGQAPHLLFLQDTDGDDIADSRSILMTGFGLEDRHELLNGFAWGPDGWLYMTHGVFTHSKVKNPNAPADDGVIMNAAVARFHPRTKQFQVFADGTSNPWGVDFDRAGNAFVSACVIDHLFHMAPGGIYARQAGMPAFPYAYHLLPSIVEHKHFRAAYAGVQVYQGDQYPESYRGTIFIGNIHDNAVHQDRLMPNGSSFKASFVQDFVRANDGWFRPVSTQVGPDGALWIMDWYDKYPCYQNARADPEGVDREYGRIWRVIYTADSESVALEKRRRQKFDIGKLSTLELAQTLEHRNVWHRRMAQRLLSERRDPAAKLALAELLTHGRTLEARLSALWTLHSSEQLDHLILDACANDPEAAIRVWAARFTGDRREASTAALQRLKSLARDRDPGVRLAVATAARQFVSESLTVNRPPAATLDEIPTGEILALLVEASADAKDPLIPFLIWMAAEPHIAHDASGALGWFLEHGADHLPLAAQLTRKTMRRICDLGQPRRLDQAAEFVEAIAGKNDALTVAALDGLLEGQQGKALLPTQPVSRFFSKLLASSNREIVSRAQQLGALWGDGPAVQSVLSKINNPHLGLQERIEAIQVAKQLKNDAARATMLTAVSQSTRGSQQFTVEAIRALGEIGGDNVSQELIRRWNTFGSIVRRAAAEALASRSRWALDLLSAIETKKISPNDIPATVIRTLGQSNDEMIRDRARQAIGRIREPDADKLKIIAQKKPVVLNGSVDLEAGYEVAQRACFTCHKLHGEGAGADVGPDLTGVGRSTLDALLANIIDPNQVIGKGYENVEVETKDGRLISGRLVEQTDARVKLLSAGPKEEVVAHSDIASMRLSELSVMPEGLEQMPDPDFRNLIWYLLNPPGDNRPMTPELRRELIGE